MESIVIRGTFSSDPSLHYLKIISLEISNIFIKTALVLYVAYICFILDLLNVCSWKVFFKVE